MTRNYNILFLQVKARRTGGLHSQNWSEEITTTGTYSMFFLLRSMFLFLLCILAELHVDNVCILHIHS